MIGKALTMDGYNEKKWFVYMGDHHEGPFSLAEIQARMNARQVTSTQYVWCEGMADWKVMAEVPEFQGLLAAPPPPVAAVEEPVQAVVMEPTITQPSTVSLEPEQRSDLKEEIQRSSIPLASETPVARPVDPIAARPAEAPQPVASKKSSGFRLSRLFGILTLLVFLGLIAAGVTGHLNPVLQSPRVREALEATANFTHPLLVQLSEKVPALAKWISPIQPLDDVAVEEYEELKAAARGKPEAGVKVALALSQADLLAPAFYVASNLPDGARFEVLVHGIPDTLLNRTDLDAKAAALTAKRVGKSESVRVDASGVLPRGQYLVVVTEAEQQPTEVANFLSTIQEQPKGPAELAARIPRNKKIVVWKSYFLGGPKDAVYVQRLKAYHDKLTETAANERAELSQFAVTLESQLAESMAKLKQLRKGRLTPAQKRAWAEFHNKWMTLSEQIKKKFEGMTPETVQQNYFYGSLYQQLRQTSEQVERAHMFHNLYFTTTVAPKAYEIQVGEADSLAQAGIQALKAKIEQAQKLPATPNGMPRREGL